MGIVKLLEILGEEASILHTESGREWAAPDLVARINDNPNANETTCDYTILNGFIYRVDGNDSLARRPYGKILKSGKIQPDHLQSLDEGGQLWRELKRLTYEE